MTTPRRGAARKQGPPQRLLAAALKYATWGWPVFPLHSVRDGKCSCGQERCTSPGKHPRSAHGLKDATTDEGTIRKWWHQWPDANIGVATGAISGLVVLDIDPGRGGAEAFDTLMHRHGPLPSTLEQTTGGGGRHLFFKHPGSQLKVPSRNGALGPGLDVKGDGGYVVIPPSLHSSGRRYQWNGLTFDVAPLPDWLLTLLADQPRQDAARPGDAAPIPEGRRNVELTSLAGAMRRRGMGTEAITAALLAENKSRCQPPLPEDEVRRIAQSVGRYPPGPAPAAPTSDSAEPARYDPTTDFAFERRPWPDPLSTEALYGLAGEWCKTVEPHSEADLAALLLQFLVGFGNLIGRTAYFQVAGDRHYTNLFVVIVGASSKARKGTSWSQTRMLLGPLDADWAEKCIKSGLSTGEGLVSNVRDPREAREPIRKNGRTVGYQRVLVDEGVADKRLLVVEPEFARVLQVCEREANTLSALLRDAWDRGNLSVLVKRDAPIATGAHISIIGHITTEEVRRFLTEKTAAGGFANRFLWACARRSKCLPEGGELHKVGLAPLRRDLERAVAFARQAGEITRDSAAREFWYTIYPDLSEGRPGLFGTITNRGEAQVMRLAMLYALLDCSPTVQLPHLKAALAVWRYCEASARFIFGDAIGDPIADEILRALRQRRAQGMTRNELLDLFHRNRKATEITRALAVLLELGVVRSVKEETDGRPAERWFPL